MDVERPRTGIDIHGTRRRRGWDPTRAAERTGWRKGLAVACVRSLGSSCRSPRASAGAPEAFRWPVSHTSRRRPRMTGHGSYGQMRPVVLTWVAPARAAVRASHVSQCA